jgi:hypothetical protein
MPFKDGNELEFVGGDRLRRRSLRSTTPSYRRPSSCGRSAYGELNYYRLEAGKFEDFVSYGLKSFAHEGVT